MYLIVWMFLDSLLWGVDDTEETLSRYDWPFHWAQRRRGAGEKNRALLATGSASEWHSDLGLVRWPILCFWMPVIISRDKLPSTGSIAD